MNCGLLGEKLGHSYSPIIHHCLGSYQYSLFEKSPNELGSFIKHGDYIGLNVTIPYKKAAIKFCDQLSPIAEKLGAVNTIIKDPNGKIIGHNTDYFGFMSMVHHSGLNPKGKRVLVLGTGGASATVQAVLNEMGAKVAVISRSGRHNYKNMYRFSGTAIIVNATPVGMYPNNGASLVDLSRFPKLEGVLDLIYNPARTQLIIDAQQLGLVAENGLWMLVAQAKESAEWFSGEKIEDSVISAIYNNLSERMENIVLIGMPGCGKSTIGKLLAEATGRILIDTDSEIIKRSGMPIPVFFVQYGEDAFRQIESDVLSDICKQSGLVIATGGGCVTQDRNYPVMHQNSRIVWIKRNLDALATDDRPLSQQNTVLELYNRRKDSYFRFADYVVENNTDPSNAVSKIIAMEGKL